MSFRLIVRLPSGVRGCSDSDEASDAFVLYRRLSRGRVQVEKILDLRSGQGRTISSAELEAIAQSTSPRRLLASV